MRKKNKLLFSAWIIGLILCELVLIINLIKKGNKDNIFTFIIAIILVFGCFIPGIFINYKYMKEDKKTKNIFLKIAELIFIFIMFVGVFESSLDSKTTVTQVNKVINALRGEKKDVKLERFEIVLENQKEVYEVDEIINYSINVYPEKSKKSKITCSYDEEYLFVDILKKTIVPLKNGKTTICFYDSSNHEIKYDVEINIYSLKIEEIIIKNDLEVFLNSGEKHQVIKDIYPESASGLKVNYSSSDESVASVDSNGVITAHKTGEAIIKCFDTDVSDEIYVYVNDVTMIDIINDEIIVYPGYSGEAEFKVVCNNNVAFNYKRVSFAYDYNAPIKINNKVTDKDNVILYSIRNDKIKFYKEEEFVLNMYYTYPGGTVLSETVRVILKPIKNISLDDIDLSKTETDINYNIYYNDNETITKFFTVPIEYKDITEKEESNFKITSNSTVNFDLSRYNEIVVDFDNEKIDNINDFEIYFYPDKDKDEYLTIRIHINKLYVNVTDYDFEMKYLYEESEEMKNEIWYESFNINILEEVIYTGDEYINSGLYIKPTDESLNYIDFSCTKYGVIERLSFKNKSVVDCQIVFDICTYQDYYENNDCLKKRYIIDIKTKPTDLLVENNGVYTNEDIYVDVLLNSTISYNYKAEFNYQNKNVIGPDNNRKYFTSVSSNENARSSVDNKLNIIGDYYGESIVTIFFKNSVEGVNIHIRIVDEKGNIPSSKDISVDIISFNEGYEPKENNTIFSVGTKMKFLIPGEHYEFYSSDPQVISVNKDGEAECLSQGKAIVIARSFNDESKVIEYNLSVFDIVYSFTLNDFKYENGEYRITLKINKLYKLTFTEELDQEYKYLKETDSEHFKLGNDGTVIISKKGIYRGKITCGDEKSPYRKDIAFVIECNDTGLSSLVTYFLRKAIGHFGLFMALGFFAVLSFAFIKKYSFNKLIVYAGIVVFGFFFAFVTEFIQKLDPSRSYAVKDMGIDYMGYLLGIIISVVFVLILKLIKKIFIKDSKESV